MLDIKHVFAEYLNRGPEPLKFKLKRDEYSNWIFTNEGSNSGFKVFNGLCVEIDDTKDTIHQLRLSGFVTKMDKMDSRDVPDKDAVDLRIDWQQVKPCDEIFTTVSMTNFNSEICLECRVITIFPIDDVNLGDLKKFTIEKKCPPYVVGHRGLGEELGLAIQENTVYGFNRCADLKVDFVELDVHFTKDDEIIVFHDFFMDVENCGKKNEIRSLTYGEVLCQLGVRSGTGLFPTLDTVMHDVSQSIGMLIEMKYPLLRCDGTREINSESSDPDIYYMRKNEYLDKILKKIFDNLNLKPRKVVLLSFDPDICLMLKLKQTICPVFCITRGDLLDNVVNHADNRITHYNNAVSWAGFCGLDGIVCRYHEKLTENYKVLRDSKYLTFIYGKIPRSAEFYQNSRSIGLDGLIVDDVEDYLKGIDRS